MLTFFSKGGIVPADSDDDSLVNSRRYSIWYVFNEANNDWRNSWDTEIQDGIKKVKEYIRVHKPKIVLFVGMTFALFWWGRGVVAGPVEASKNDLKSADYYLLPSSSPNPRNSRKWIFEESKNCGQWLQE